MIYNNLQQTTKNKKTAQKIERFLKKAMILRQTSWYKDKYLYICQTTNHKNNEKSYLFSRFSFNFRTISYIKNRVK